MRKDARGNLAGFMHPIDKDMPPAPASVPPWPCLSS